MLFRSLVKTPKVYVRDSGLLHALLGLGEREALLGHPVVGASWECFVIENLLNTAALSAQPPVASFYRSAAGAEIDLLLHWPDGRAWAIEIKRSLSPKVERGFHHACEDVQPAERFVVYPGTEAYRMSDSLRAVPLADLLARLA